MIETGLKIGLEHFAELFGDRQVGIGLIEPEHRLEPDRLEIALSLSLLERVGVDKLAVDAPAVFAEGGGGELDDRNWWVSVNEEAAES